MSRRLEQVINGVEGMQYMTSSSTNTGESSITVTFDIGRDPDLAAVDVQNRVNQALGRMPQEVRTNGITVTKNTAGFIGAIVFFSDDDRYDSLFISNYVDLYVRDAFKRVPGVGNVIIFGERKFAMRLWLDPVRLAARGLTGGDVVNALREQNVQVAAGSIGDSPAAADQLYQMSVRAAGRLTSASQFEDIVVKAGRDGALVRVKDVGRVELGAENYSSLLRFGGRAAAGVGIQLLPSANAIEVFAGIQERWKSGFYRIAMAAGVPIVLAGFDYPRKVIFFGPTFQPTGDYEKDLPVLQSHFRADMALKPENYGIPG